MARQRHGAAAGLLTAGPAAVLEAVLIVLATIAACAALAYELARRLPVLDALLGCTSSTFKRSHLAEARPPTRWAPLSYDLGG
jgi:hypothetical protein